MRIDPEISGGHYGAQSIQEITKAGTIMVPAHFSFWLIILVYLYLLYDIVRILYIFTINWHHGRIRSMRIDPEISGGHYGAQSIQEITKAGTIMVPAHFSFWLIILVYLYLLYDIVRILYIFTINVHISHGRIDLIMT